MNGTIDVGSLCIECGNDTAFGSGRFVNRIPADNGVREGYLCAECQSADCEACALDATGADNGLIQSLIDTIEENGETGALCDLHAPEEETE